MSKSVAATFLASIYILSSVFILPTDTQAASSNGQKVYSFGVDDWCPQHCQDNSNSEGYIIDIVRAIFATEKARIEILYVPSQRAVKGTQEGALTACWHQQKTSNPELLFHDSPIGHQEYCIYANINTDWVYNNFSNSKNTVVSYLKVSGLGELDDYISANNNTNGIQLFVGSDNYVVNLFKFLNHGRSDSVIITSDVYHYSVIRGIIPDKFKVMGCLGKEMLYVGLSPKNEKWSSEIQTIIDCGVQKLHHSGKLELIFRSYGIPYFEAQQ